MTGFTREQFDRERKPRYGAANPERFRVDLWERMTREGAWMSWVRSVVGASAEFGPPVDGRPSASPDWTWERMGQSVTPLPDGREILIAGEHEDWYSADFRIYNDLFVRTPDGEVEIYGYPTEVFPPTDFHSATLIGDRILTIGCMGYAEDRRPGTTPVFEFDVRTLAVRRVDTRGDGPGWISGHTAVHDPAARTISVFGGQVTVMRSGRPALRESLGRYLLHLDDLRWEAVMSGHTAWTFVITAPDERPDGEMIAKDWHESFRQHEQARDEALDIAVGWPGPKPVRRMWRGSLHRLTALDGSRVWFKTTFEGVEVIVEGEVPRPRVELAVEALRKALGEATGRDWTSQER